MRALLTIVWAILAALLCWRAYDDKAPAIEQDIRTRSSEAVKPLNADAGVIVDGRFVTVRGPEPDEAAKSNKLTAADGVWGALGPYDSLWVPAAVAETRAVEFLSAQKMPDGSVVLTGLTPSETTKAAAKTAFSGQVDNRLEVSGKGGESVLGAIGDAFVQLAALDAGALVITEGKMKLLGATADPAAAIAADALQQAAPGVWQVVVKGPASAISGAPGRLGIAKTPDGSIIASGEISAETDRAAILDAFRTTNPAAAIVDRMVVRGRDLPQTGAIARLQARKRWRRWIGAICLSKARKPISQALRPRTRFPASQTLSATQSKLILLRGPQMLMPIVLQSWKRAPPHLPKNLRTRNGALLISKKCRAVCRQTSKLRAAGSKN